MAEPIASHAVLRVTHGRAREITDQLAAEAPLEIRLVTHEGERTLTVTMRTPGADADLALGFLLAERVIESPAQLQSLAACAHNPNVIRVAFAPGAEPRLDGLARSFASSSSCGACGKSSVEAVLSTVPSEPVPLGPRCVTAAALQTIPAALRLGQGIFEATGGLHAVASFSFTGTLLRACEDIGRHNAFDKLVGVTARGAGTPLANCIVALSGRAGFELVQKAAVARVPVLVALGAPSTLAVELAARTGITLVGFLRADSFNVYTHAERLATAVTLGAVS
jgi:FdhD protein